MRTFAIILALAVASAHAGDVTGLVEDCGSTGGSIKSLFMDGCDQFEDDECVVHKGDTARGQLVFSATSSVDSLYCKIYGVLAGIEVPFPGGCPQVDACQDLSTGDCPIEAGEEFTYEVSMKIEPLYPSGSVIGKWTLKVGPSGNDADFVCFKIPIKISS